MPGPAFAISLLCICCLLRTGGVSETTGFSGQDEFTKKEGQTDHKSLPLSDRQQGISRVEPYMSGPVHSDIGGESTGSRLKYAPEFL